MGTQVGFDYEYKVFSKGDLKQFSLELAKFCVVSASDNHHFIRRKEDGFETSEHLSVVEMDNIGSYTPQLESIGFHCKAHIIILSFKYVPKFLHINYILDCDLAESKKLISDIEVTLGITRVVEIENGVYQRLDKVICPAIDTSSNTDIETDKDLPQESEENLSINLPNIWGETTQRLRLQLSEDSYQTWLAPLIPKMNGKQLILYCQSEFAKIWLESRYAKLIKESIDSSIEKISFEVNGKSPLEGNEGNNQFYLRVDEPLFELMMKVYERETENPVGSFEEYYKKVIRLHCLEHMADD